MKTRDLMMTAAVLAAVLAFGGESFAAGRGAAGATSARTTTPTTTQVRPADSQRADGTYLTTGTTASGATTRPTNGRGVMDGTGINAVTPTTAQ